MSAWERKLFAQELANLVRDQFQSWKIPIGVEHGVVPEDFGNDRMTKVEWEQDQIVFQLRITQYNGNLCVDPTVIMPDGKILVYKNQNVSRYGYLLSEEDWMLIADSFARDWYPNMQQRIKQYSLSS